MSKNQEGQVWKRTSMTVGEKLGILKLSGKQGSLGTGAKAMWNGKQAG